MSSDGKTDTGMPTPRSYSSRITLTLYAEGRSIPLSKIGPGYVVPTDPIELPKCFAKVVMTVDERPRIWDVHLIHGAVPYDDQVAAVDCATMELP